MPINVKRQPIRFMPDPERIITRLFTPGDDNRSRALIRKVAELPEDDVLQTFNQVLRSFSQRHRNITRVFENNFTAILPLLKELDIDADSFSLKRKLLLGSYFTREFSIESTAFFNPSIIEDPDQTNLGEEGAKRIIMSFRATGEGHISSIVFRGGVIGRDNLMTFTEPGSLVDAPETVFRQIYQKKSFLRKLKELDIPPDIVHPVLFQLKDSFTQDELKTAIENCTGAGDSPSANSRALQTICWIANSDYELNFSLDTAISERVIFSSSSAESGGIEDARFVRFREDDGDIKYYASYTAFNGFAILPKLLETRDFYHFNISPIHGEYAQNKGLALFPRKIKGKYAMISCYDSMNSYIMYSEDIKLWRNVARIDMELHPWEYWRLGNCGSPLETDRGWLLITHGVGPMRGYSLGALLLDLDDPTRVIGHLREPLLSPTENERAGYSPNVVYSCGSLIHDNRLFLPYSAADAFSTLAVIPLDELLETLCKTCPTGTEAKRTEKHPSVLVVDDEPVIRKFLSQLLNEEGYDVEMACDGAEALLSIGGKRFDVILLDVNMPMLDGFQLMSVIKKKNIEARVVILSGDERENLEDRGLLTNVEFLHKPVRALQLLELMKRLTRAD